MVREGKAPKKVRRGRFAGIEAGLWKATPRSRIKQDGADLLLARKGVCEVATC